MTTNDSKSQPTGWVVVDFEDSDLAVYDGHSFFGADDDDQTWLKVNPYQCEDYAEAVRTGTEEVHPWPLPAAVLDRLKAAHPDQDWSQVPVAVEAEKPGRWVMFDSAPEPYDTKTFRDQDGWYESAAKCYHPWTTREGVDAYALDNRLDASRFAPVNLDDLPAPAVSEPSEIEKLRVENAKLSARVGWLDMLDTEEGRRTFANEALRVDVEELRAEIEHLTRERDNARASLESVAKQLRKEADEAMRERDEARASEDERFKLYSELLTQRWRVAERLGVVVGTDLTDEKTWVPDAKQLRKEADEAREELSRCKQAHSAAEDDVESLREQLGKARLSRRDEFAKAALCGLLACPIVEECIPDDLAKAVLRFADATIRAIDGAGGA